MYVNGDTIIKLAALAGALGTLGVILYRVFCWMERQKMQDIENQNIKKEQCIICFALLATLDGLKQLGANGGVTEAHKKLEKHLNQSAHNWEGE